MYIPHTIFLNVSFNTKLKQNIYRQSFNLPCLTIDDSYIKQMSFRGVVKKLQNIHNLKQPDYHLNFFEYELAQSGECKFIGAHRLI
jgi:hypothetical protein